MVKFQVEINTYLMHVRVIIKLLMGYNVHACRVRSFLINCQVISNPHDSSQDI